MPSNAEKPPAPTPSRGPRSASRRSRTIADAIGIGVGSLMLLVGLGRMLLLPLECDGHRMDPGQVCTTTEKGHTVTRSFEQQRSLRQTTDGFLIIGGLVVGAGSAVLLIRRRSSA